MWTHVYMYMHVVILSVMVHWFCTVSMKMSKHLETEYFSTEYSTSFVDFQLEGLEFLERTANIKFTKDKCISHRCGCSP